MIQGLTFQWGIERLHWRSVNQHPKCGMELARERQVGRWGENDTLQEIEITLVEL